MQRLLGMPRSLPTNEKERERAASLALDAQHTRLRALRDQRTAASASAKLAIRRKVMEFAPDARDYYRNRYVETDDDRRRDERERDARVVDKKMKEVEKNYVPTMKKLRAIGEALASNVPLPDERFNEIMGNIRPLLSAEEFNIFEQEMNAIRKERHEENLSLTTAYYKKLLNSHFVLLVFAFIFPRLIKETIPIDIANKVVLVLQFYTVRLAIFFYNNFVDKNTDINKRLEEGKLLSLEIYKELSAPTLEARAIATSARAAATAMAISSTSARAISARAAARATTRAATSTRATQGVNLIQVLNKINGYVSKLMTNNKDFFNNKSIDFLSFKLFYLSVFIVLLYFASGFSFDELEIMIKKTPIKKSPLLLGRSPQIKLLGGGGKKKPKSKRTTKPKKKA
jgi:hypothetical protein